MKKPRLFIDEAFCWGCRTCEVACKQENHVPDGVKFISLTEELCQKTDGSPNMIFHLNICRHCDDPPCEAECPVGAISKREDGIVLLNHEECTGCEACLEACPFNAIDFDNVNNVARKCNLCYQRVDSGLLPACADNICLGHCIHFGEEDAVQQMASGVRPPTEGLPV
ncbi:MAG: 4Fe-4S binding protein [Deltaproteobacteria bacterium]|jgi:Fe-S-cluster-containing dehydrogenase component